MIEVDNQMYAILLRPQIKDDGDFANNAYVDTAGWGHLRVLFIMGDTDIAAGSTDESTAPLVEECDTYDGSYTAVSGAALAAVLSANADNQLHAIDIDLTKSHKRFMRVQAPHAGNGTNGVNMAILAILSRPEGNAPDTAALRGFTAQVKA